MTTTDEDLRDANRRFYRALSRLDLDAMDEIWLDESWVCCVHPGWPMLTGWEKIRASWQRIFEATESHHVDPEQITVRVFGDVGWVSCVERIVIPSETGRNVSVAASTNFFVRAPSGWKMVLHHASPIPIELPHSPPTQVH